MCNDMCIASNFHYTKCLNYKGGKNITFGHWNNRPVILKTSNGDNQRNFDREIGDSMKIIDFLDRIREHIQENFGIIDRRSNEDLIELLWSDSNIETLLSTDNLTPYEVATQRSFQRSLWSLINQDEYLFTKYFSDNRYLPYVFGTCGSYYAVEYAPSTGALDPDVFHMSRLTRHSWSERVKLAHDLLNVVRSLEEDFEEAVHMCDVKGSNFGISQEGIVKAIDTDTVFFRSKIAKIIGDTGTCLADDDCHFFDCLGKCDTETRTCNAVVMNNNLEVIAS